MTVKIFELEKSIFDRIDSDNHVKYTASQAWFMNKVQFENKDNKLVKTREFLSGGKGGALLLIFLGILAIMSLFLISGMIFFFEYSSERIGLITIVVIFTILGLIAFSEIFSTIRFTNKMIRMDNSKLGVNDLKVFLRTSYILQTRTKQFTVITVLTFAYGIFGEFADNLFIYTIAFFEYFNLFILGGFAELLGSEITPLTGIFNALLFILAGFTSLLIASVVVYTYVKFCFNLIRLEIPEDIKNASRNKLSKVSDVRNLKFYIP